MTKEQRIMDFCGRWTEYAPNESDHLVISNNPFMDYLREGGFFTAPASTKYHGAYEGGLYDHSLNVFNRLAWMTDKLGLEWQRPESPFIVGMFHDLCKCDQYTPVMGQVLERESDNGVKVFCPGVTSYEYNTNTLLKGHGAKSVMILSRFITLTEEELLCIRYHMGAYEKEEWAELDMAIRRYPNVLMTHTADMLASKVDEF